MERRGERNGGRRVGGESERRRGRPPAAPEHKTAPFSLRLTDGERALVDRAAYRMTGARKSVAAWARAVLVGAARAELEQETGAGEGPRKAG